MRIGARVFLGYFLIVGLGVFFLMRIFVEELKPGVRQSTEETLVDTANLLAELVAGEVKQGTIASGQWKRAVDAYARRKLSARISGFVKAGVNHRIYVTDARGIVLYDSDGKDVGADYSRWNDVYLTLRGRYGARSTRVNPGNELSSIMYVAAPIRDGDTIIGVVTVAKPNLSVQPFIEAGRRHLLRAGVVLVLLSLAVGLAFSLAMSRSVGKVVHYAEDLSKGRRVPQPALPGELRSLGRAVTELRQQLDGKSYVEEYIHAFLHEIKSPLAAIYGAAELLEGEMTAQERLRFLENIRSECERLREILDRLLDLARVEQRQALDVREPIPLRAVADEVGASIEPLLSAARVQFVIDVAQFLSVRGDPFLVRQALHNLVDNALQFARPGTAITVSARSEGGRVQLRVHNFGDPIPEFALPRLFERFYSLPRPGTQKRSTGLGLPFVREVALLHQGEATIENAPEGGVTASLLLPLA